MSICAHEDWVPVEVRDRADGAVRVVANVCRDCLDRLPAGWGCPGCGFAEIRHLCHAAPTRQLVSPCPVHHAD